MRFEAKVGPKEGEVVRPRNGDFVATLDNQHTKEEAIEAAKKWCRLLEWKDEDFLRVTFKDAATDREVVCVACADLDSD